MFIGIKMDRPLTTLFIFLILSQVILVLFDIFIGAIMMKYIFVGFIIGISSLIFLKISVSYREIILFSPYLLFNFLYIFNMEDADALVMVGNQLSYLIVIYMITNVKWTEGNLRILSKSFYVLLPFLIVLSFVFQDIINPNTLGTLIMLLAFFPLLYHSFYKKSVSRLSLAFSVIAAISLVLVADARSVGVSIALIILTIVLWKTIVKSKLLYNLYFFSFLALNFFVVAIYPSIYKWSIYPTLNQWSIQLTQKPLLTGRELIWERTFHKIMEAPLLGIHSSVTPQDIFPTGLSAHNLYLQIGLQVGVIGILALLLFFFFIWRTFWHARYDKRVMLSAGFLIAIITHQSFEVTLTQNQYLVGLLQWMTIAFGLHFSFKKIREDKVGGE